MNNISISMQQLSNLVRNTKSYFCVFEQQQITILQNLINKMLSYAINNNNIINSKLFEILNKIIQKHNLKIQNNTIVFPQFAYFVNTDNYGKMYANFLEKIYSYLNKCSNLEDFEDFFQLLDNNDIVKYTNMTSENYEENSLMTANDIQVLITNSALKNYIFGDLNRIDFYDGQEKTLQAIRAKLSTGNKHEQIQESDAKTLVDVQDVKTILANIEKDNINNKNQNSAQN